MSQAYGPGDRLHHLVETGATPATRACRDAGGAGEWHALRVCLGVTDTTQEVWREADRLLIPAQPRLFPTCPEEPDLVYLNDESPGIERVRCGSGFRYRLPNGRFLAADAELVAWIRRLAIPPAWTEVWISPRPDAHLLATGRDARGRKQYRYHPRWREVRERLKFDRLAEVARGLPRLRRRVRADLERPRLSAERVVACVVRLLDRTLIRVGNSVYARTNRTFGATTLRRRHVRRVAPDALLLRFRSKGGQLREVTLEDDRAARVVRRCWQLPGQALFQYEDERGLLHGVGSTEVNAYLHENLDAGASAKDLRTWGGTALAAELLEAHDAPPADERELKRREISALDAVAGVLGNTRTTCRKHYVHPGLAPAHGAGALGEAFGRARADRAPRGLRLAERAVLTWLEGRR